MKTGHLLEAYEAFQNLTQLSIQLTKRQADFREGDQSITLTEEQLSQILQSIGDSKKTWEFLELYLTRIPPVAMSLYVMNDALWKMMERNPWGKSKMLAMSTIPYCFWDQNEESATNPKAVNRWELGNPSIELKSNPPTLSVIGEGGDFSGFIERSQLTMRRFGMIDSRGLVPNYLYKPLRIDVSLEEAELELHPAPLDYLDYDFSEKAQTFHDHGVLIRTDGKRVRLTVDKKESTMNGDVLLLVGVSIDPADTSYRGPLVDVWLWLFSKLIK